MNADRLTLWLAQGAGTGRAPVAPGTVGSLPGLLWLLLLAAPGRGWAFAVGLAAGILGAVRVCGRAEILLGRKDPPSVVLDEIAALPLAWAGWILLDLAAGKAFPSWAALFTGSGLAWSAAAFVLFRVLDALKPPPLHALQRLRGGWGVVMDDVAAALVAGMLIGALRWGWAAAA